jgi:UDP-glucose 4-epimerase
MTDCHLVTGGAGFIGSHLVDSLLARGASRVVVVDNFFLGDSNNLAAALAEHGDALVVYREDAADPAAMADLGKN